MPGISKLSIDALLVAIPSLNDAALVARLDGVVEVVRHLDYIARCRDARGFPYEPFADLKVADAAGFVDLLAADNGDAKRLYESMRTMLGLGTPSRGS